MNMFQSLANFIWAVADLLRGHYRPPQYERVMLPLTVLRRFDCVLEDSKEDVLAAYEKIKDKDPEVIDKILNQKAKDRNGNSLGFHNHSKLDFAKLKGDPDNIGRHLTDYINGFSQNIQQIFERFEFDKEIEKLEESNRLYQVVSKFAEIDLHPDRVDNITMGLLFEDLIRRFNEAANETAGDHFTPREVIRLMTNLLLEPDTDVLTQEGKIITVCDPACGTGGMLAEAQNWIRAHNPDAIVKVYGQDYNPRSYAVAASDLLIKGHTDSRIEYGNTLTDDKFEGMRFDYLMANPPFGVDWKAEKKIIDRMPNFRGYSGKLPRVNDGALLFLIHMISKFQPYEEGNTEKLGTRIGIIFNGSPLFTGGAGSGESEIRRWIIENDWLEAIVALPEQMFYNTGIGTFIWIVTNRKSLHRKGKIELIDARERYAPMRRSLGNKRRYLTEDDIEAVTREHGTFEDAPTSKIFDNLDFGYRRVTIQRPLRLRFQLTDEAKERFLDTCPHLLDAVLDIEAELGNEPYSDWNEVWGEIQSIVKRNGGWSKGAKGTAERKLFREVFTTVDPDAAPVIAKRGKKLSDQITDDLFPGHGLPKDKDMDREKIAALCGIYRGKDGTEYLYETDNDLKDTENIPLKESVFGYFLREVRPYVEDAWIDIDPKNRDEQDGGVGKVGYEINFNRLFFHYEPPRPLEEIDRELAEVEEHIMDLLREVTQ